MIAAIKKYMKVTLKPIVNLNDNQFYLSAKEEIEYKLCPWVSILSMNATPKKEYKKDNISVNATKTLTFCNYSIVQPIKLALAGINEETVATWVDELLKELPSHIVINERKITIDVKSIGYTDSESKIRDKYLAILTINFEYGIFKSKIIPLVGKIEQGKVSYE